MSLLNFGVKKKLDSIYEKQEWGDLIMTTKNFIEKNQTQLIAWFNLEDEINPLKLAVDYVIWSQTLNKQPYTEIIHNRPVYFTEFLTDRQFNHKNN